MQNETRAKELFSQAILSYKNGELVLAKKQFQEIVDGFPGTSEAHRSGKLLAELEPIGSPGIRKVDEENVSSVGGRLGKRYRDAYRVAEATIFFGGVAKFLGVVFGVVGVIMAILVAEESKSIAVAAGIFGVGGGLSVYLIGVLISAQGQVLIASLDKAINTSPFLSNPERAAIMGID